ncbi:DUF1827 family protein [Vagococcus sp. BWB3-3]|uniref:DUF1827 family protein n=1 Tax=Vagococcus allomyrinae TaxID=2794353 RepID=A0A940SUM7_9ENTE|nr:DUF1827 family protein [Vagococcus allomyrinae]MBP1041475.1 DUF1827 family protein [Vagococcus allomyrinae]
MKLIDVTNSYPDLVNKQLENTDANFIKVFTLGKSSVIYTEAPTHKEILITNKQRNIKKDEVETVLRRLVKDPNDKDSLSIIKLDGIVEISIPIPSKAEKVAEA